MPHSRIISLFVLPRYHRAQTGMNGSCISCRWQWAGRKALSLPICAARSNTSTGSLLVNNTGYSRATDRRQSAHAAIRTRRRRKLCQVAMPGPGRNTEGRVYNRRKGRQPRPIKTGVTYYAGRSQITVHVAVKRTSAEKTPQARAGSASPSSGRAGGRAHPHSWTEAQRRAEAANMAKSSFSPI